MRGAYLLIALAWLLNITAWLLPAVTGVGGVEFTTRRFKVFLMEAAIGLAHSHPGDIDSFTRSAMICSRF